MDRFAPLPCSMELGPLYDLVRGFGLGLELRVIRIKALGLGSVDSGFRDEKGVKSRGGGSAL